MKFKSRSDKRYGKFLFILICFLVYLFVWFFEFAPFFYVVSGLHIIISIVGPGALWLIILTDMLTITNIYVN